MQTIGTDHSQRTLLSPRILILLSMLAVGFTVPIGDLAHAGKLERTTKCATKGDARVSKSISRKVVMHAVKKYQLEDIITKDDVKTAKKEVYEFLKWKLGNPSAICAQYITAGTKHFKKAYADEAAAALVGVALPGKGSSDIQLPKELADVLKQAYEKAGDGFAKALEEEYGIPPALTNEVVKEVRKYADKATDHLGINIPKGFDYDNDELEFLIKLKRKAQA